MGKVESERVAPQMSATAIQKLASTFVPIDWNRDEKPFPSPSGQVGAFPDGLVATFPRLSRFRHRSAPFPVERVEWAWSEIRHVGVNTIIRLPNRAGVVKRPSPAFWVPAYVGLTIHAARSIAIEIPFLQREESDGLRIDLPRDEYDARALEILENDPVASLWIAMLRTHVDANSRYPIRPRTRQRSADPEEER